VNVFVIKQNISWFVVGTFIAVIAFMASNYFSYGQITEDLALQPISIESVKKVYKANDGR
jgi:hypothetical protein